MPRRLTELEKQELRKWLEDHNVNLSKFHREFSDCVPVAHLIKKYYPKLVDLHNYPSRNNTMLKLNNWETFNHKVLLKLGLQQNKTQLEKLAKGMPGAIELLLADLMCQVQNRLSKEEKVVDEQEQAWSENDEVMVININKKIGDAIVQMPQKMILYSIYEQKARESQAKDSYLESANQKISHLENIIKLKSERIEELCGQLAKLSVRTLLRQHNLDHSSSSSLRIESKMNAIPECSPGNVAINMSGIASNTPNSATTTEILGKSFNNCGVNLNGGNNALFVSATNTSMSSGDGSM